MDGPIDDVEGMKVFEGEEQLGGIESTALLAEAAVALEMMKELAAVDEGQDQVQLLLRLEAWTHVRG